MFFRKYIVSRSCCKKMQHVIFDCQREPYITPTMTMSTFICRMMLMQASIVEFEPGGEFVAPPQDDFDSYFLPELDDLT